MTEQDRIEMGIEVGETLKDKAFLLAIKKMKDGCISDIILNDPDHLTSRAACAKLRVISSFLDELRVLENDGKVALSKQKA